MLIILQITLQIGGKSDECQKHSSSEKLQNIYQIKFFNSYNYVIIRMK